MRDLAGGWRQWAHVAHSPLQLSTHLMKRKSLHSDGHQAKGNMAISAARIVAVFLLGFAVGALLIALQRRARIDKIKQEFQAQLEAIVAQQSAGDAAASAKAPVSDAKEESPAQAGPSRAA